MKIAIIGSGGREHALVHHLSNSKKITKIYSIPGNAGTEEISVNIDLNLENFQDLYMLPGCLGSNLLYCQ